MPINRWRQTQSDNSQHSIFRVGQPAAKPRRPTMVKVLPSVGRRWSARQIAVSKKFGDFSKEIFVVSGRCRLTRLGEEADCTKCSCQKASSTSRVKRCALFRNKGHRRTFSDDCYLSHPTAVPQISFGHSFKVARSSSKKGRLWQKNAGQ